jgi:hypothetical protein
MVRQEIKCPLTGLDAMVGDYDHNCSSFKIQLKEIKDCEYWFFGNSKAGLDEGTKKVFAKLIKDDPIKQGKLLRWLYLNNKNTNFKIMALHPDCIENTSENDKQCEKQTKFINEVTSVLEQKITPTQKSDWLLEYIYHDMEGLGTKKPITNAELFPIVATIEPTEVSSLMGTLVEKKYIKPNTLNEQFPPLGQKTAVFEFYPTPKGFEAYEALKKGKIDSGFGFMALKFSTDTYISPANVIYNKYWKNAVKEAGYPIYTQYEKGGFGNINKNMEENIRTCKFLIADVTPPEEEEVICKKEDCEKQKMFGPPNPNVMWEAGFAEGLEIPVLYVCDKNRCPTKDVFDISHHNTLYYSEETMKDACKDLQKFIFNTFAKDAQ